MYYLLDRFGPRRWLDHTQKPNVKGSLFRKGRRITVDVPQPLEFALRALDPNSNEDSPLLPEYLTGPIPLFRTDFVEALKQAGVDNLDLFDAVVVDPDAGERLENYQAVNIVGTIAAADMAASAATVHPGGPVIDVEFDGLVVDEEKAAGALMFRLAEATRAILVHQKLKDQLLAAGFAELKFLDPKDCAL